MGAVRFLVIGDLRTRWRSWAATALLVGVLGGAALAAASGARRTQTAYPRMVAATRDGDVLVSPDTAGLAGFYDDVAHLPEVTALGASAGVGVVALDQAGHPDLANFPLAGASVDGRMGYTIARPNLLAGRLPRPDSATEVLANRAIARHLHLHVGDAVRALTFRQIPDDPSQIDPAAGTPVTLTVVGIGVFPNEVVPTTQQDTARLLMVTPAFFRAHADPGQVPYDSAYLRLRPGTDVDRFRRTVDAIAAAHPETGAPLLFAGQANRRAAVERAIRPQVVALASFAALTAITALLVIWQLLARQIGLDARQRRVHAVLGMAPGQLFATAMLRVVVTAAAGGLLAVVIAVAASPLFPIGPARLAETHPGIAANVALLALGLVVVIGLLVAVAVVPAWRAALGPRREPDPVSRPPRLTSLLVRAPAWAGLPASATIGVGMAVETGRATDAAPVRTTVAGTALALAAVVTAVVFGTNLSHLVGTPRLYGWDWDVAVDGGFQVLAAQDVTPSLNDDPAVAGVSGGVYGDLSVGGLEVPAIGVDLLRGAVFPTLTDGRPPAGPDEIVLGRKVLESLHRSVGDVVDVQVGAARTPARPMRIVGSSVFPKLGRGGFPPTALGDGAAVARAVLADPTSKNTAGAYNFLLVRYSGRRGDRVGVDRVAGDLARFGHDCVTAVCVRGSQRPGQVSGYADVRRTPLVLAALLGALAAATLGHTLVTSVRRRRRDLAILKTLGFVRHQVSTAIAWQSTTITVVALMAGLPLGVIAGRWLWRLFAAQLGVATFAEVPFAAITIAVPAAIIAANLIAAAPARIAARTRPAVVLRSE